MAKPRSVAKAEQEVDDILKKMSEEKQGHESPAPDAISLENPPQDKPDVPSPSTPSTPDKITPPSSGKSGDEDWKHKYEVLQGKYNAEVPRLNTEVRLLKSENTTYNSQLREMQEQIKFLISQGGSPPTEKREEGDRSAESIKSIEDQYGSDFVDKLRVLFNKEFQKNLQPYNEKISDIEARQASSVWDSYYTNLSNRIPGWQDINKDPRFIEWLNSNHQQFSNKPFMDILRDSHGRADAHAVVKIFEGYLSSIKTPPATPEIAPSNKREELESMVSPGKNKTNTTPASAGDEFVSLAKVEKFYEDLRRGKYVGKEAEAKKLDEFYTLAVASGRVK